jgi:hypothetical protein
MKTSITIEGPALVVICGLEREPVLVAPQDERDRVVAWLEREYPDWATLTATTAARSLASRIG